MSTVTELRDATKTFYGGASSRLIIGLTNMTNDNNVEEINDTVLEAHCEATIGRFELETGVTVDVSNLAHKNILIHGVRASLEAAKGKDSSLVRETETKFRNLMITFRRKMRGGMKSSSTLRPSTEAPNALPDSDRTQIAFSNTKRHANRVREYND